MNFILFYFIIIVKLLTIYTVYIKLPSNIRDVIEKSKKKKCVDKTCLNRSSTRINYIFNLSFQLFEHKKLIKKQVRFPIAFHIA